MGIIKEFLDVMFVGLIIISLAQVFGTALRDVNMMCVLSADQILRGNNVLKAIHSNSSDAYKMAITMDFMAAMFAMQVISTLTKVFGTALRDVNLMCALSADLIQ